MEYPKRLRNLAKRITPEIETMNNMSELDGWLSRAEEVVGYCEEKCAARKARDGMTAGDRHTQRIRDAEKKRIKIQDEEFEERAKDQEQAKADEGATKKKAAEAA